MNNSLLEIKNLNVSTDKKSIVKNISFKLKKNNILGIVGESGSGKSITALSILKVIRFQRAKSIWEFIF